MGQNNQQVLEAGKIYGVGEQYFQVMYADHEKAICETLSRDWTTPKGFITTGKIWAVNNNQADYEETDFIEERAGVEITAEITRPLFCKKISYTLGYETL